MSELTVMEALLQDATKNVARIKEYLEVTNYAQPSFSRDTPTTTLPISAPEKVKIARQNLIESSFKLYQLALGPNEYLPTLAVGFQYVAGLRWLVHFKVFDSVPIKGIISYGELAKILSVPEGQLKSVVRLAITNGLFDESESGYVSHSATSALIATNTNFALWAAFMTGASAPTAAKFAEATEKWPGSLKKTETAYNLAFETDLPFFDHMSTIPEMTRQFAGYMKSVTDGEGTDLKHLINGYDWAALGDATIVDIGGSKGHASIALSKAYPKLRFIVQDLSENIEDGKTSLSTEDDSISSRITFEKHDFFNPQPVSDADVYFLRMIIHDWADNEAATILSNTVRAMKSGAKLIIMDTILPRPGQIPATQERFLRLRDLTMMQVFNSKERSPEDWKALLELVDVRLTLVYTGQPFGSVMSIMEWVVVEKEQ